MRYLVWLTGGIRACLFRHSRQRDTFSLGFHNSNRLAIYKEKTIGIAGIYWGLAHRHPASGIQVGSIAILHRPFTDAELRVYILAGIRFGRRYRSSDYGYGIIISLFLARK
jgi:hypothetical protein